MTHFQPASLWPGWPFIHSASCGAPIRHEVIEMSAKSELVTVCSRQSPEVRLQRMAIMLIKLMVPA